MVRDGVVVVLPLYLLVLVLEVMVVMEPPNAASSDVGTYTCFASNNVGTGQSTTTTLSVTGSKCVLYNFPYLICVIYL
jgi:hypothetical protein